MHALSNYVERLLPFERQYFLWLNSQRSDFLDSFMYVYSDRETWFPICAVLFLTILYRLRWKEILLLCLCALILGLLCDRFPADCIKPFFERLRPTHHPDYKDVVNIVNDTRGGRFGFISIHVSNGFGIAAFTSLLFRYKPYTLTVYLWALITAYSRVYLGVHFITDVIGGMLWGTFVALLVFTFHSFCRHQIFHIPKEDMFNSILKPRKAHLLIGMFFVTLMYVFLCGLFVGTT